MSRAATGTGLTLVLLADTHERHREIEVPDGDVLIHAGDFTLFSSSATAICDFNTWPGELPHRSDAISAHRQAVSSVSALYHAPP